jgi:GNAT superfamily N-acetyltransferase
VLVARLAQARRQVDQPGATTQPEASSVGAGVKPAGVPPIDTMRPAASATSRWRREDAGSMTRPLRIRIFMPSSFPATMLITAMRTAMPKVTCGRMTLCLPSTTAESISTPRLIGPGCMTMASGLASCSFSGVRPKLLKNSCDDGSSAPLMRSFCSRSMMITSQPRMPSSSVWQTRTPICAMSAGHQRLGADHAHLGAAQRGERVDVGARHARVQHVADDRHREVGEVLLVVADGVHVEQPLRGVRVAAVAGVDDVHVRRDVLGDQVGRARLAVAHHEQVGRHRRQVGDGVQQRLALAAEERAMSRLMTSADSRVAAISKVVRVRVLFSKNRLNTLLPRSSGTFLTSRSLTPTKPAGGVEDVRDDVARQAFHRQQVDQLAVACSTGDCACRAWVSWRAHLEAEAPVVVARQCSDCESGKATRAAA